MPLYRHRKVQPPPHPPHPAPVAHGVVAFPPAAQFIVITVEPLSRVKLPAISKITAPQPAPPAPDVGAPHQALTLVPPEPPHAPM